jgi:cyanophycin synthetase
MGLAAQRRRSLRLWHELRAFAAVAERRREERFEALRARFYREYWERAAAAVGARCEELGAGILRLRRGEDWTCVRGSAVMLDSRLALDLAGDKPLTHRLLAERGVPVPRHLEFAAEDPGAAQGFLRGSGGAVVVKPAVGTAAGKGVTTGIRDAAGLRRAVSRASLHARRLLVEEQVAGTSYRLLYLDGELLDAIRRDPPAVEGDGVHTLRELIAAENARRLAAPPVTALHPIRLDLECAGALRAQGRSLGSRPARGERVVVKGACNENAARENHGVRDTLHASIAALGRALMAHFDLGLCGIDLIAPKLDVPLESSGGVVGELNTTPGLHHHELVADPQARVDAGPRILEHLLARRRERRVRAAASEART